MPADPSTPTSIAVHTIVDGAATGPALVLDEPLSLWGGLDPATGRIIDRLHPRHGAVVTGTVLVMPSGRGSSSASSIVVESVRLGTAPVAFVLQERDALLALGCIVAEELYQHTIPLVVGRPRDLSVIADGHEVEVGDSRLTISTSGRASTPCDRR